jgi:K+-transporting ATPase, KdpF subunit
MDARNYDTHWDDYFGAHRTLRSLVGGTTMSFIYWIGGIVSILLFVYLAIALLKPERFS